MAATPKPAGSFGVADAADAGPLRGPEPPSGWARPGERWSGAGGRRRPRRIPSDSALGTRACWREASTGPLRSSRRRSWAARTPRRTSTARSPPRVKRSRSYRRRQSDSRTWAARRRFKGDAAQSLHREPLTPMQLDGHEVLVEVSCGRGACHWYVNLLQPRECTILSLLTGTDSDEALPPPHDGLFPLLSIIRTVHFDTSAK